jgi:cell division protein FtsL
MTQRFRTVTGVLVGLLVFGPLAQGAETVAVQADLDSAITKTLDQEGAARATITALLQRDDVRKIAEGRGLDLRRAEAAVSTLQGDELQKLSLLAARADAQLAGGDPVLHLSLVAVLLIVIVIILLVD